ncbi:GNAT family N-acetyltransferase [Pseudoalteromonas fenneropenaei]|uniref:GNAT family N-acetyltransferase n=1 Tax=Pseudoalteromonas fenneropenaei TaxID=1737459 RepID=A0ABV7CJG6_9GAMM
MSNLISLQPITQANYAAVCDLDVCPLQQDYVACNMWSLVEAFYNQGHTCRAIYQDDTPVGFLMWVQGSDTRVSIWRFMIDSAFQQQGIGRQALSLALDEIKSTPGLTNIEICYNPSNPVAKDFYSQFGFVEVGMDEDNEDMLAEIALA